MHKEEEKQKYIQEIEALKKEKEEIEANSVIR